MKISKRIAIFSLVAAGLMVAQANVVTAANPFGDECPITSPITGGCETTPTPPITSPTDTPVPTITIVPTATPTTVPSVTPTVVPSVTPTVTPTPVQAADLAFGQMTANYGLTTASGNTPFSLKITVANYGNASASASLLRVQGTSQVWNVAIRALGPKGDFQAVTISSAFSGKSQKLSLMVDAKNQIKESNENNNTTYFGLVKTNVLKGKVNIGLLAGLNIAMTGYNLQLTSKETGQVYNIATDKNGAFSATLESGDYTIKPQNIGWFYFSPSEQLVHLNNDVTNLNFSGVLRLFR